MIKLLLFTFSLYIYVHHKAYKPLQDNKVTGRPSEGYCSPSSNHPSNRDLNGTRDARSVSVASAINKCTAAPPMLKLLQQDSSLYYTQLLTECTTKTASKEGEERAKSVKIKQNPKTPKMAKRARAVLRH